MARIRRSRSAADFVQASLFDVTLRPERRYYRQMLDALTRSDFGAVALDAELTISKLFGTVWAAQPVPRDGSVEEAFGVGLVEYAAQRPNPTSVALLQTVSVLAPVREVRELAGAAAAALVARGLPSPQWTSVVGSAAPGGCWAYEDAYGDQTTVVTEFASGPVRHGLVVRIDHARLGAAADASLTLDVDETIGSLRLEATASARTFTLRQIDQPWARSLLARAIARADLVAEVWPGFADLRAFALARLNRLADGPDPLEPVAPPPAALTADFLASHEAQALPDLELAALVANRLVEFGTDADAGQVARVSPVRWEAFLVDWWPPRTVDGDWAPVLRAWSSWAARRMALPEAARAELSTALEELLAPQ